MAAVNCSNVTVEFVHKGEDWRIAQTGHFHQLTGTVFYTFCGVDHHQAAVHRAVDCCLMVIDAAKGVEDRTRKLMEVTRLRDTPILTFMNKLDRDI